VQYWKNEAINFDCSQAGAIQRFQRFITQLEAQFGDLSPKATTIGKLKTL